MKKFKNVVLFFVFALCLNGMVAAGGKNDGSTEIEGLYRYVLENGLELYVAENDSAPLVQIKLTVLGGGIASTPETAGLFHLYEHMMFEGNSQFANNVEMEKAAQDMGVLAHNAQTGVNSVSYFFTVPANLLKKGLEFWNYAIREPLLAEDALEAQKKVVISEIEGNFADPQRIFSYSLFKNMFPKFPWRTDPAGYPELIQNASVEDLRDMLKKYYVPNNALLLVGGDVKHEEVYELVKEIFGSWERGKNPWEEEREFQLDRPFEDTEYFVMPASHVSKEQASVRVVYRGPDPCRDSRSVEVANVFDQLMDNPSGFYAESLLNIEALEIPSANYLGAGSTAMRENGMISFMSVMHSPEKNLAQRAKIFYSAVADQIVPEIIERNDVFSKADFKQVKQAMKDYYFIGMETAEQVLSQLEYCWVNFSREYFFTRTKKVKKTDINRYLEKYVAEKPALVCVLVNPEVYEMQKNDFAQEGFKEFTIENAYWWKDFEKKSGNDFKGDF